ncbi:hypothetical protein FHR32_002708 [Streptosporangium album]|uniref:WD40 repeat domain-containing protein n=1 Tax=Streptosporangium album TaxID=47479 RepID=A0A7W7RUF5_9ACTN|nr:hypothetical protein [Streptosporangium album]MBB4938403.1 hypothetical protein [Streptosporangium album]
MTIDELVRRTLHDWSDEARVPSDLASRALGRRRRSRGKTFAVVAGATATVVAAVFTVPALVQGEQRDERSAIAVVTDPSPSRETVGDPDSALPGTLVAAGDTAVYSYFTWENVKTPNGREVRKLTWRLYDKGSQAYEETPWAWLDVAPGGESVAVLEQLPARRVGVIAGRGAEVRWIDLKHPAGSVQWSPDGRKLLLTNYGGNPDESYPMVNNSQKAMPPTRTGYSVVDLDSGQIGFHPVRQDENNRFATRLDFSWSTDGTLVWEHNSTPPGTKKFYDLDGNPRSAPPEVADTYQRAGMSPSGRLVATDSPDRSAVTGVKDVGTGKVTPLTPVDGYWIEQLAAWADDDRLIAWACEFKAPDNCVGSEFRNRLVLVDVDGGKAEPLTGYRENNQKPGSWEPVFSRR